MSRARKAQPSAWRYVFMVSGILVGITLTGTEVLAPLGIPVLVASLAYGGILVLA